jgi:hypothetical protein
VSRPNNLAERRTERAASPYLISVIPTPEEVLPLMEDCIPHLIKALSLGMGLADDLQPDPQHRDPWFWSHTARWRAKKHLIGVTAHIPDSWSIAPGVANSGIHLSIAAVHHVRVLRSLGGTAPHPGRNRARRAAWIQDTLRFDDGGLPALSLLADWQDSNDEPVIHLSLPKRPWTYGSPPELHWRIPVTGDTGHDLNNLRFNPDSPNDDVLVTFRVDPAEARAG